MRIQLVTLVAGFVSLSTMMTQPAQAINLADAEPRMLTADNLWLPQIDAFAHAEDLFGDKSGSDNDSTLTPEEFAKQAIEGSNGEYTADTKVSLLARHLLQY